MDSELNYMIDKYPEFHGITTYYIAGNDHEGWYQQREGIEVGHYLQMRAEQQGRRDLKYLGYGEVDVRLKFGTGSAVMHTSSIQEVDPPMRSVTRTRSEPTATREARNPTSNS